MTMAEMCWKLDANLAQIFLFSSISPTDQQHRMRSNIKFEGKFKKEIKKGKQKKKNGERKSNQHFEAVLIYS